MSHLQYIYRRIEKIVDKCRNYSYDVFLLTVTDLPWEGEWTLPPLLTISPGGRYDMVSVMWKNRESKTVSHTHTHTQLHTRGVVEFGFYVYHCNHICMVVYMFVLPCLGERVAWAMCRRRERGAPRLTFSFHNSPVTVSTPSYHCVPLVSYSPVPSCPSVIWKNQCEAMCHATLWNDWK